MIQSRQLFKDAQKSDSITLKNTSNGGLFEGGPRFLRRYAVVGVLLQFTLYAELPTPTTPVGEVSVIRVVGAGRL
jgi:hypothetical protein